MIERLAANWVYGGALASLILFGLLPALAGSWPAALIAVYVQLPVYMLHQLEEHDRDRFRTFFNRLMKREALSRTAVFVINVPGVWGVNLAAFYLARGVDLGLGLIAPYLQLVNALAHIGPAIRTRSYNPGLATAVALFLPSAGYALWLLQQSGQAQSLDHAIGLGVSIAIHAGIIVYARAFTGST